MTQNYLEEQTIVLTSDSIFIDNPIQDLMNTRNKLFCTFTRKEELTETVARIVNNNVISHDKIFVLESKQSPEYICTYNIDSPSQSNIPSNTILLHRKKETNTLYTINALNTLIRSLNEGILDTSFIINWPNYRNTILLTQGEDIRILETKIFKIFYL